jgi:hypothetical protein
MAACLAAGSDARASFRAAAALWELDSFSADVLEITIAGRKRGRLEGVIVHDTQVNGPGHLALVRQIPVTSVARTLCDLTAVARAWTVERAVDEAFRCRPRTCERARGPRVDSAAIHVEVNGRPGRRNGPSRTPRCTRASTCQWSVVATPRTTHARRGGPCERTRPGNRRRGGRGARRRGRCRRRRAPRRRGGARWSSREPRGARIPGCLPDARRGRPSSAWLCRR